MSDEVHAHAQAVLIGCLVSHQEASEVAWAAVRVEDLDAPYRQIAESAYGLHLRGEPVTPLSVIDEMTKRGTLGRIGGAAEVFRIAAFTGDITYATDVIARVSRLRRIAAIGMRATQAADEPDADPYELSGKIVAAAQGIVDGIEAAGDVTTQTLRDFLEVPDDPYDWVIPGLLEHGDRLILTGMEGLGKALALDTPIPTPNGWSTMGSLKVGSKVFAPDGSVSHVVAATEVMRDRPCYRVRFSDGAEIVADANHLWLTETLAAREAHAKAARRAGLPIKPRGTDQRHKRRHFPAVITTRQMAETVKARGGHAVNHSIETTAPLRYPTQNLLVDPYVLGAWLGDGSSRSAVITTHPDDAEILERIKATGLTLKHRGRYAWGLSRSDELQARRLEAARLVKAGMSRRAAAREVGIDRPGGKPLVGSLQADLRNLGVLGDKHIPEAYLRADVDQRLALLQGLMDTDGTVSPESAICEFSVTNERLAHDVHELLLGLGVKVTFRSAAATLNGRTVGTRYRLCFQTELPVFHLARKANRLKPLRTRRAKLRYVVAVEPVESVPVRCIQVDREDGMFVAGTECIPTHNSVLGRQIAVCAAAGIHPFTHARIPPMRVLLIDCENGPTKLRRSLRPLRDAARHSGVDPAANMWVEAIPAGLDLTKPEDELWMVRRVSALQPDLLVTGPIYRLHAANPNDEEPARKVTRALDRCRAASNCALMTEAHTSHGTAGSERPLRPTGSSLWLRWPEFGYGIKPTEHFKPEARQVVFSSWRGDREERAWPTRLRSGTVWPWEDDAPESGSARAISGPRWAAIEGAA